MSATHSVGVFEPGSPCWATFNSPMLVARSSRRRAFSFSFAVGRSVSNSARATSTADTGCRATASRLAPWKTVVRPASWSWTIRSGPTSSDGCFNCRSSTTRSPGAPVSRITDPTPEVSQVEPYTLSMVGVPEPCWALRLWCSSTSCTPAATAC